VTVFSWYVMLWACASDKTDACKGGPKISPFSTFYNFIKYWPIFKLFSHSESGAKL